MLGKALGGILADKFGLGWVGISSLAISAVLLGFYSSFPLCGMIGIFLFNMTMPITLVMLANTLKGREGFAFGLTTLALILGAMPYYADFSLAKMWIFLSIVLSVVAIGS
jgi:FSR family fosmidomycin resistance protein-like MFS transporter